MPCQSRISSWWNDTARPSSVARRYQDTRLRTGPSPLNLEFLHRDHGAVEQLLLPVGGANAQPVAACDLQRRGCLLVFRTPAYNNRHPVRISPLSIRQRGETAFPHQMRQRPHLSPRARQHHAGLAGVRPLVAVPVIDQTGPASFLHSTRYGTGLLHDGPRWPTRHLHRAAPQTQQPATA